MSDILIVDDEKSLRLTLSLFLENAGHQVVTAEDLASAVKAVREKDWNLIISDVLLAERSGLELLRECRSLNRECPIVMITGYPNLDNTTEALRLGAFDYLSKPVTKDTLLECVDRALRRDRQRRDVQSRREEHLRKLQDLEQHVQQQTRALLENFESGETLPPEKSLPDEPNAPRAGRGGRYLRIGNFLLPPEGLDLEELNNHILRKALDLNDGNKTRTAQYLGLTRDALRSRVKHIEDAEE